MKSHVFVTAFLVSMFFSMAGNVQAQVRNDSFGSKELGADSTNTGSPKTKSPKTAMIRALIFPGLGQFYNEQYIKAGIVLIGQSVLVGLSIYYNNQAEASTTAFEEAFYEDRRNLMYWLIGAGTLISMLDAYIDAHLYNFDTGPELELRIGYCGSHTGWQNLPRIGFSLRAIF